MPEDERRDLVWKGLEGGCILQIGIAEGGYNFHMSPRDVVNDGSLKPFTDWFIGEYFTPLSSSVRANEVLRTLHFASDFSCFQGADQETDFVDFLRIEAAFSKKKNIRFSYLLILNYGQDISKTNFWLWPRNVDFAPCLQTFAFNNISYHFLSKS